MQHRHLTLELEGRSDVLLRVVGLLCRRGCEIRHLTFAPPDAHRSGRIEVHVGVGARHAGSLAAWLGNLIEVTSVTEHRVQRARSVA